MMIEMEVREIQLSEQLSQQIVVLEEKDGERRFPIFIGPVEAMALDAAVHGRRNPRPLTHDLIFNVIEGLGAELEAVCISELRDTVFYGKLILRLADEQQVQIDSRPSDAMVLAMKKRVPVYVASEVLEATTEGDSEDGGI